tara:strand:+ start:2114 stop:3682 length:1569 start_codon:yes stop_codon:yes gene_type:complete
MKHYESHYELQDKILKGVRILADNVCSTLGPKGRNVILKSNGRPPVITKDGVTIAEFIELEDPIENVGAQIVKQAASRTNEEAGDGTTTSTLLTNEILTEARKYVNSGVSPTELRRGINRGATEIVEKIKEASRQISSRKDIKHIATISANGDTDIGELLATAIDQAGFDGAISVEEARSTETSLSLLEGFIFDSGYVSPRFITDERRGLVRYDDCLLFITDHKLEHVEPVLPVLELAARENKPLVVVADEVEGQFLASLIMNSVRGSMKVAAVKAPRYGEERRNILKDMAIATGAAFITRESGKQFKDVRLVDLGRAKTVEIKRAETTIVGGAADYELLEKRIEDLKCQIEEEDNIELCQRTQERVNRLASGVAIIHVGAPTQIDMIEKKHRIEDALEAVNAAQKGGYHLGGGVSLCRISKALKPPKELNAEQRIGFNIIVSACEGPVKQMAKNAGMSPDIVVEQVRKLKGSKGINFANGNIVDMYKVGIIDPVLVTCSAVSNAASVAGTLITTNHAIVEK